MHRIVSTVTTLDQHFSAIAQTPDVYHPPRCPHCGHGKLHSHGCYYRKADRDSPPDKTRNPIPIRRYCCVGCRHTCSRLPMCIAPRRWYHWGCQHAALYCLVCGQSLRSTAGQTGRARSTLRRWRNWLLERSETFIFYLRSRFPELGRYVGPGAFWKNTLSTFSLGQAMAWLDRDL